MITTLRALKIGILVFCILVCFTGCGEIKETISSESNSNIENVSQNSTKYLKETIALPKENFIIANVCNANSIIYVFGNEITDKPNNYYIYGFEDKDVKYQYRCVWDDEFRHDIVASDVDETGTIWLLEYLWDISYDSNGNKVDEVLADIWVEKIDANGFSGNVLDMSQVDQPYELRARDGKIYLFESNYFTVHAFSGEYLGQSSFSAQHIGLPSFSQNSNLYICYTNRNEDHIGLIDATDYSLEMSFKPEINIYDICDGKRYDFYINDGNKLYGYDSNISQITEVIDLNLSGLGQEYKGILPTENEKFIYYTNHDLYILEPTSVAPENIKVLTLGTMEPLFLKDAVSEFNSMSAEYAITIEDYSKYNTDENPEGGITKLNLDIVSGHAPDILDLSDLPRDQYENNGILEDLYPYIRNDSALKDINLVQSVLSVLENDGKLFTLIPCYSIMSIEGYKNDIEKYRALEFKDLNEIKYQMGEGHNPFGKTMSKNRFLESMFSLTDLKFIDWESGICSFDEEFISLLEFANTLPDEYDLSSDLQMIAAREQLISLQYISSFADLVAFDYYFGGDLELYGIPSARDSGAVLCPYISLGISASSNNKTGAWEFLKLFLGDNYQSNYANRLFTITEYGLNQSLELTKSWQDANGTLTLRDIYGKEVQIKSNNEKCFRLLEKLLSSVTSVYNYNQGVYEIIWREVQPYFSGIKTAEETAEIVQSKVAIYVSEHK